MLPSELLVARIKGGRICPGYLSTEGADRILATRLISLYSKSLGKKKSEISGAAKKIESEGNDFRVVRGLCALLDRLSVFEVRSPVDPQALRESLFSHGAPVLDEGKRREALGHAAARFGIDPEEMLGYIWADLPDERVLASFSEPSPDDLLASYNLSLTQTLLFRATFLEISVKGNPRSILSAVKRLGLMYSIRSVDGDSASITVEGPTSMIKLTERYGTSIAKLLPHILESKAWEIRAQISRGAFGRKRLLDFCLSASDGISFPESQRRDEGYDSFVEDSFARRFRALETRWTLLREPGLISTPAGILIPDFAFELDGRRIYLEIVGFWTPEYLEKKISKLNSLPAGFGLIVAVNRSLASADRFRRAGTNIVEFDDEVPLRPILEFLEEIEKSISKEGAKRLQNVKIEPVSDVVDLAETAAGLGVPCETLVERLAESPPKGYLLAGKYLISERTISELRRILSTERSLGAIEEKFRALGVADVIPVLTRLGYSVRWTGLSPGSAEVLKK
ncbi:MAG: DUF790 family protein [Candidatus Methanosuratincola petrocarbonis]